MSVGRRSVGLFIPPMIFSIRCHLGGMLVPPPPKTAPPLQDLPYATAFSRQTLLQVATQCPLPG